MARNSSPRQRIETLKREVRILRSELRKAPRGGRGNGEGQISAAARHWWSRALRSQDKAQRAVADAYKVVLRRGENAVELGRRQVHRRPVTVVLVALAVGLLLGQIFTARRWSRY